MSDFAGGSPAIGFEHSDSGSRSVAISVFKPEQLDKLEELIADHISTGGSLREVLTNIIEPEMIEFSSRALKRFCLLVCEAKNVRLEIKRVLWRSGVSLMDGESVGDIGRECHVSKQAVQQGSSIYDEVLDIRSQSKRSKEAREKMSKRNARNFKGKPIWEKP